MHLKKVFCPFIVENGFNMFMWIGQNVNTDFLQSVFGVQSATQIDVEKVSCIIVLNTRRCFQVLGKVLAIAPRQLSRAHSASSSECVTKASLYFPQMTTM